MANKEHLSDLDESSDIEKQSYTIIVFAKPEDDGQIENIREMSLECDMETAMDICGKIARKEWKKHRKQSKSEMRGVIYENEMLADMMFDPKWKKWLILSTAHHPWRTVFPECVHDI